MTYSTHKKCKLLILQDLHHFCVYVYLCTFNAPQSKIFASFYVYVIAKLLLIILRCFHNNYFIYIDIEYPHICLPDTSKKNKKLSHVNGESGGL